MSRSSTTSQRAKTPRTAPDEPIPFVPTEPAPKPMPAPVMEYDDAERVLAEELQQHEATHAAVLETLGAINSRHPHHLSLVSLLSFALCGEHHPYPSSILSHVADDIESYRCAYGEGEGEEPVDPKAFNTMLWGWQRRVQVAGILAHREDRARFFAKGGAK